MKTALAMCVLLSGCGGALGSAQTATIYTGEAVLSAQLAVADHRAETIAQMQREAREAAPDDEALRLATFDRLVAERRVVLDSAAQAVDVAARGWRALRAVLAAWESGDDAESNWQRTAACVGAAVSNLIVALEASHVPVPAQVAEAASALAQFAENMCGTLPGDWAVGGDSATMSVPARSGP